MLETRLSGEMADRVKRTASEYDVLRRSEWMPYQVRQGLSYFKRSEWVVGEDIISSRPEKHVYEVFVGIDSEYYQECLWKPFTGDDLYHASLSSRHVKGSEIFQSLDYDTRRKVERRNKIKNLGYRRRSPRGFDV
jgi:hypothetical protein